MSPLVIRLFNPLQVDMSGLFMDKESKKSWLEIWNHILKYKSIPVLFYLVPINISYP